MTPASIPIGQWAEVLDREYLSEFIPDGGASVKFAVPLDADTQPTISRLRQAAATRDLLFLEANAATVKLHMIDQLFFHLSGQVPWDRLARAQLFRLASRDGYKIDPTGTGPVEQLVATANELEPAFVRGELRRRITQPVFKDQSLAKDFRVAMTQLCLAELSGGDEGVTTSRVILDWLTGR